MTTFYDICDRNNCPRAQAMVGMDCCFQQHPIILFSVYIYICIYIFIYLYSVGGGGRGVLTRYRPCTVMSTDSQTKYDIQSPNPFALIPLHRLYTLLSGWKRICIVCTCVLLEDRTSIQPLRRKMNMFRQMTVGRSQVR